MKNDQYKQDGHDEDSFRYQKTPDTFSLNDFDADEKILEETVGDDVDFQSLVRLMDQDEKFICLAIRMGYQKNEIAFMMSVHPSTVTRSYTDLLIKIKLWRVTQ